MSTTPNQPASPPPTPAAQAPAPTSAAPTQPREVRVVSHSNIFYWWPVWAIGFLMAGWTMFIDGHYMVTVPAGSKAVITEELKHTDPKEGTITVQGREAIILPKDKKLTRSDPDSPVPQDPRIHMARNKNLGVIFVLALLLVITITNVPLRGVWSLVVIITIVLLTVILALIGWWERIINTIHILDIRINAGGYLLISTFLLGIWLLAVFVFDPRTCIVFKSNIFTVYTIGDREKDFPTYNMTVERQPTDFFRHYILGLGAGDLVVKTTGGAETHHFPLPNVLFATRAKAQIDVLRERAGGKLG